MKVAECCPLLAHNRKPDCFMFSLRMVSKNRICGREFLKRNLTNLYCALFYYSYFIDLFDQNSTGMPCLKIIRILTVPVLTIETSWGT